MLTLILILASALQVPDTNSGAAKDSGAAKVAQKAKSKSNVAASTPEQAWRTFMVAMVTGDGPTLRAVTLPTDDFDWLLKGEAAPANRIEEIKAQIAKLPIRALKPGDKIKLPRNREFTVSKADVTKDRAMLLPDGDPIPHRLQNVDGRWRVDAAPIIAARKAADAARKKAGKAGR
jgi:hypothetical protein